MRKITLIALFACAATAACSSNSTSGAGDDDAGVVEDTGGGYDASMPLHDASPAVDARVDAASQNTDSGANDASAPIDASNGNDAAPTDATPPSDAAPYTYDWEQGANGMCPSPPMTLTGTVALGQACATALDCAPTCCMCGGALTNTFLAVECSAGVCVDGCAIAQSHADCTH
jgi:hypothetical protein